MSRFFYSVSFRAPLRLRERRHWINKTNELCGRKKNSIFCGCGYRQRSKRLAATGKSLKTLQPTGMLLWTISMQRRMIWTRNTVLAGFLCWWLESHLGIQKGQMMESKRRCLKWCGINRMKTDSKNLTMSEREKKLWKTVTREKTVDKRLSWEMFRNLF